ncbi:MAG TPA: hypothetical protein ENI63_00125 [Candidatus Kaiserbacteria bacterium]|nr:hypothetical protein [Candidatus Kaiserbacteria bacterium]
MNYFKKLFEQSSYYFISNVIVMIAGFISFPIWTRIFTKAEYGVFSLVGITISLGVGFSKFGLQHAALRYHSDFKEKKTNLDMSYYYTTLFMGSLLISGMIISIALLSIETLFRNYIDRPLLELIPLVAVLIFTGTITSVLTMFIRADNRAKLYSIFIVIKKYGGLLLALFIVFHFMRNLRGLFMGFALSDILMLTFLIVLFLNKMKITRISFPFLKEAIRYSFPLIWMELSNMILNFGDRYLIQFYMGSDSVGIYSAGYNLTNMAQSFLTTPLRLAIIPMYLQIWNREGERRTINFLSNTLDYYFMLAIPIVVGMIWYGKEIIIVLATSKFQESAIVIPYIVIPLVLHGAYVIYGAGFFIQKKTKILMYLALTAGIVNIALNIILIPKFGILGAAYATLIAYILLSSLIALISYKFLKINIQLKKLLIYLFLSFFTMMAISIYPAKNILELLIKIAVGIIVYSIGAFIIDIKIRQKVLSILLKRG